MRVPLVYAHAPFVRSFVCLAVSPAFVWSELFQDESSVDLTVLRDRRVLDPVSIRGQGCEQRLLPVHGRVAQHAKEYSLRVDPSAESKSLNVSEFCYMVLKMPQSAAQ